MYFKYSRNRKKAVIRDCRKEPVAKKAEPWDIMSGKGDGMIKKRRITRKTRSRHITELPVEERAHYIEERKQRTTEARRQERNTHVMIAVLICLVLASGIFIYETDKWQPSEDTEIPVAAVVEPAPTPTPVPTAWDRIWANASRYPDSFLEALRRNPEIADFVEAYPDTPAEKSGGTPPDGKTAGYAALSPVGQPVGVCAIRSFQRGDIRVRADLPFPWSCSV